MNMKYKMKKQENVDQIKQILSSDITDDVNENVFNQLIKTDPDEREEGKKLLISSLTDVMDDGVRAENIQSAKTEVKQHIKYSNLDENIKKPRSEERRVGKESRSRWYTKQGKKR